MIASLIRRTRVDRFVVGLVSAFACAVISPQGGIAAPYLPSDDGEVLEQLPWRPTDPDARTDRAAHDALAAAPGDVGVAVAAARVDVVNARRRGDPRFLGRAQAALAPWWNDAEPPTAVQLLRASIRQSLHDFDGAGADLDAVLGRDPRNPQAWLMRATIAQARGDYDRAGEGCRRLAAAAGRSVAVRRMGIACASSVASFTGSAAVAVARLEDLLRTAGDSDADTRGWILGMLADIAVRLGRSEEAHRRYREALATLPGDTPLLTGYADLLLIERDAAGVLALIADESRVDGLLLRVALAESLSGGPELDAHVAELAERFAANRLRGDESHLREEARFTLELRHDEHTALALAERNWARQREPEDARVLLAAATAAGDRASADRVIAWIAASGLEDAELARLVAVDQTGRGRRVAHGS